VALLTAAQVVQAKRMRSAFKTISQIAQAFEVSSTTIENALKPGYRPKPDSESDLGAE
jgi:DNA-binding phage protein